MALGTGEEHEKDTGERWLLTYADMITLLMLFFIILYAMSTLDAKKYETLSEEVSQTFLEGNFTILVDRSENRGTGLMEIARAGQPVEITTDANRDGVGGRSAINTMAVSSLQSLIKTGRTKLIPTERGITVSLASDLFFASSSAALAEESYPIIQEVAAFLMQLPNDLVVEGHADAAPPDPGVWGSNWELSSARAVAVLKALMDYGIQESRLSLSAFGSQKPVVAGDLPEARAQNRRVDILILVPP